MTILVQELRAQIAQLEKDLSAIRGSCKALGSENQSLRIGRQAAYEEAARLRKVNEVLTAENIRLAHRLQQVKA